MWVFMMWIMMIIWLSSPRLQFDKFPWASLQLRLQIWKKWKGKCCRKFQKKEENDKEGARKESFWVKHKLIFQVDWPIQTNSNQFKSIQTTVSRAVGHHSHHDHHHDLNHHHHDHHYDHYQDNLHDHHLHGHHHQHDDDHQTTCLQGGMAQGAVVSHQEVSSSDDWTWTQLSSSPSPSSSSSSL